MADRTLTSDEYMALLTERRDAYMAATTTPTYQPRSWVAQPLLEQFVQPGDELLFTPPTEQPAPRRTPESRPARPAQSLDDLRARRDRLQVEADRLAAAEVTDRAAAGGVALGPARTRRLAERVDGRLRRHGDLTRRIARLDARIARQTETEEAHRG